MCNFPRQQFKLLIFFVFLYATNLQALPFSNLFVFGDSIVDAGNTQALLVGDGGPDPTPAAAGYFQGRFSNGPNYADLLGQQIIGSNLTPSLAGGSNFSFGGARARDAGPIPSLGAQFGFFNASLGGSSADSDALYLINAGGNDIRDIVQNGLGGLPPAEQIIDDAVAAVINQISNLAALGADRFLVAGAGDVGAIPETLALGSDAVTVGRTYTEQFNDELLMALGMLGLSIDLEFLDVLAIGDAIVADPEAFGLPADLNSTTPCLFVASDAPGGLLDGCTGFSFFDPVHPTTAVHSIIAQAAVEAIPTPSTLLLLGCGLLLMRRGVQTKQA